MIPVLLGALLTCAGVNDTAAIQDLVRTELQIELAGPCVVDAAKGISVSSARTINAERATITALPGCRAAVCRIWETIPGSSNIRYFGGRIVGNKINPAVYREGWRVDSAENVEISNVTFEDWGDAIWIGGNEQSTNTFLANLSVSGSSRNGIAIVNARRTTLIRSRVIGTYGNPGAGVDIEGSEEDAVDVVSISDSTFSQNVIGIYIQQGKAHVPPKHVNVQGCRLAMNAKFGMIVNNLDEGKILDNEYTDSDVCLTIGAFTPETMAANLTVSENLLRGCRRTLILTGLRDSRVEGNNIGNARPEIVSLGVGGHMSLQMGGVQ